MPTLLDLYAKAEFLRKEIEYQLDNYWQEKKKLLIIEDSLVENRELLRSLSETIRIFENANDFSAITDENREAEISSFKKSCPFK